MASFLVVDDDEIQRTVIKNRIVKLGYTVVDYAENGWEAFEKYKLHKPTYVTMDLSMPEYNGVKNGIESLKLIKEFDSKAQVIMVSAYGEEKLLIEALSNGAKTYLVKPIQEDNLKKALTFNK